VRGERDVYFERELAKWSARYPAIRSHIVLSDAAAAGSSRRQGFVTDAVAADFSDLTGFKAYFAGPPQMVDAATALVSGRGIETRDIHADAFFPAPIDTRHLVVTS
jgi:ferredoxin-NAD(P)+ reductase (naphthalene dioxygenase ferredoxin-specific)